MSDPFLVRNDGATNMTGVAPNQPKPLTAGFGDAADTSLSMVNTNIPSTGWYCSSFSSSCNTTGFQDITVIWGMLTFYLKLTVGCEIIVVTV